MRSVTVIGAGLAGCEAAWNLANSGVSVRLIEQKPEKKSPAHSSDMFAELVCSNSLKAERTASAGGLLKAEMAALGSLIIETAYQCRVPAGGALAVDRDVFSKIITEKIKSHPLIEVVSKEQTDIPDGVAIIATGPLTEGGLADNILKLCGERLSFYDAAAPIITKESVDFDSAFMQSRYDRGAEGSDGDYINCPLTREEYERFHSELRDAKRAVTHEFDKPLQVYEGCMPVEILASRGVETLRYGALKPVGLRDPRTGHRPWANVQLRCENSEDTLYNIVGFQTNLTFPEQKRVFSLIPALRSAEFVRFGVMHRNSFINSPEALSENLSLESNKNIFFAGQITGVEGYMESASSGILAGINTGRYIKNEPPLILPKTTMLGALTAYITDETVKSLQPMGANFGILPPLPEHIRDKHQRYEELAKRSLEYFKQIF